MGPPRGARKRRPGGQPTAGRFAKPAAAARRATPDEPDAHSPRMLKVDPAAQKLHRTAALARLSCVAKARLRTRFHQLRVQGIGASTGVLQAFDHTRALAALCAWVVKEHAFSATRERLEDALVRAVLKAHAHEAELVKRDQRERKRRESFVKLCRRVYGEAEGKIEKVEAAFAVERTELHAQLRRERTKVDHAERRTRELQETVRLSVSTTAQANEVLSKRTVAHAQQRTTSSKKLGAARKRLVGVRGRAEALGDDAKLLREELRASQRKQRTLANANRANPDERALFATEVRAVEDRAAYHEHRALAERQGRRTLHGRVDVAVARAEQAISVAGGDAPAVDAALRQLARGVAAAFQVSPKAAKNVLEKRWAAVAAGAAAMGPASKLDDPREVAHARATAPGVIRALDDLDACDGADDFDACDGAADPCARHARRIALARFRVAAGGRPGGDLGGAAAACGVPPLSTEGLALFLEAIRNAEAEAAPPRGRGAGTATTHRAASAGAYTSSRFAAAARVAGLAARKRASSVPAARTTNAALPPEPVVALADGSVAPASQVPAGTLLANGQAMPAGRVVALADGSVAPASQVPAGTLLANGQAIPAGRSVAPSAPSQPAAPAVPLQTPAPAALSRAAPPRLAPRPSSAAAPPRDGVDAAAATPAAERRRIMAAALAGTPAHPTSASTGPDIAVAARVGARVGALAAKIRGRRLAPGGGAPRPASAPPREMTDAPAATPAAERRRIMAAALAGTPSRPSETASVAPSPPDEARLRVASSPPDEARLRDERKRANDLAARRAASAKRAFDAAETKAKELQAALDEARSEAPASARRAAEARAEELQAALYEARTEAPTRKHAALAEECAQIRTRLGRRALRSLVQVLAAEDARATFSAFGRWARLSAAKASPAAVEEEEEAAAPAAARARGRRTLPVPAAAEEEASGPKLGFGAIARLGAAAARARGRAADRSPAAPPARPRKARPAAGRAGTVPVALRVARESKVNHSTGPARLQQWRGSEDNESAETSEAEGGAAGTTSRGPAAVDAASTSSRDRTSSGEMLRSVALAEEPRPASPAGGNAFDDTTVSSKEDEGPPLLAGGDRIDTPADAQRAALQALATQNRALATALHATPRDATVAAAEIRVLEARIDSFRRDAQEARRRHRQALAAMTLELGSLRDQRESDRRDLAARLRDESLVVHELTKRCDALARELRGADVLHPSLTDTAKASLRASRQAARTLVVSPDEVSDATPRSRGAMDELLDSNAVLVRELGVV